MKLEGFNIGQFVTSKSGRDKSKLYLIVAADDCCIYLADGKKWTAGHPKRKNKKHLQRINQISQSVADSLERSGTADNEELVQILSNYQLKTGNQEDI